MSKGQNPLASHVSGSIARNNPLEGGPRFEAMTDGTGVVASTWGDYATRLMDLRDIGPQEALDLLQLTVRDLRDDRVHFEGGEGYSFFVNAMDRNYRERAKKDLDVEVRRLQAIVDEIKSGYKLPDEGEARKQAKDIQAEITEADARYQQIANPTEEQYIKHRKEQDRRCFERDALNSGYAIPLEEFVSVMLSTNVTNGDSPSELASIWIRSLSRALWDLDFDAAHTELPVGEIVVGEGMFTEMRRGLTDTGELVDTYAKQAWEVIRPVFETGSIEEHFLVTNQLGN